MRKWLPVTEGRSMLSCMTPAHQHSLSNSSVYCVVQLNYGDGSVHQCLLWPYMQYAGQRRWKTGSEGQYVWIEKANELLFQVSAVAAA